MSVESRRALGSRYELVDRLGSGAMGEVWRAWDRTREGYVAAKLLRRDFTRDTEIITRFIQERSILMSLDHPNIVTVHDLVVEGEDLAIVMDLVEGPNLGSHLHSVGTLAAGDAVAVACAVLDGLTAAHAQSCLHRDVKPDNVLLTDAGDLHGDHVKLSDFSIARLAQESTVQATGLLGTPGYMPPELFVHGTFSAASDVYATGVLLYELLGGRTPFSGSGTAHTVGYRHVHVEPPRLPVAPPLWHVVSTMLAKDPTVRLSAAATAAALRDLPPEVLAAAALPVQPVPDQWEDSGRTAVRGEPLHVQEDAADLDVGRTNVNRPAEDGAPVAAAPGAVQALVPGSDGLDAAETQIGRQAPRHRSPVLEPAVTSEEPTRRRRRWPWVVGVLVVLSLATVLLLVTGVIGGSDGTDEEAGPEGSGGPAGPAAITASGPGATYASGLRSETTAEYDPQSRTVALTIGYQAGGTPLDGELLQVLPPVEEGETCPVVDWTAGASVVPVNPTVAGVSFRCGHRLEPGPIEAGPVDVTAVVYLDLGESGEGLQQWLDSVDDATSTALGSFRSSYEYAVQRLEGISVEAANVTRTSPGTPIPYTVNPVWASGVDRTTPLFRSPVRGQVTGALTSVAGGGLEAVDVDVCRGAVKARSGVDLVADYAESGCVLSVTVGELWDETTFDILPSGS